MGCCGNKTSKAVSKAPIKAINPWAKTSSTTTTNRPVANIFGTPKVKSSFKIGR